jgi:hypothetical protein
VCVRDPSRPIWCRFGTELTAWTCSVANGGMWCAHPRAQEVHP